MTPIFTRRIDTRQIARIATLLLLAPALAGCVQPEETPATQAATAPGVELVADRPAASYGEVVTGPAVGPDLNATTAAAPNLVAGEWWRIAFSGDDSFYGGSEVVRVVAAVEPEGYLFGMPHEGWFKEAIAYHAPAFGDVGFDLSYAVHNEVFEPVRFPLVEGATWETMFAAQRLIATVTSADEHTAVIHLNPPAGDPEPTDPVYAALGLAGMGALVLTYDARQHEVVKFESFIGTWEVMEHGYDFEGWVTIPRGEHTAIDYGQFLPLTPGEPVVTRTQEVSGGFNRMTLMHVIAPVGPGAYRIRSVAPNGTEFVTESIPGQTFTFKFYEASDPDGTWTLEDVVGGPGATYSMGIAYHQYDIRLPDGARRSDHNHAVIR
jgi:hypothetical protein